MKTLGEKQKSLLSFVETMSNFKHDSSKRGKEIYGMARLKAGGAIIHLRSLGVTEETHPFFKEAIIKFEYWK